MPFAAQAQEEARAQRRDDEDRQREVADGDPGRAPRGAEHQRRCTRRTAPVMSESVRNGSALWARRYVDWANETCMRTVAANRQAAVPAGSSRSPSSRSLARRTRDRADADGARQDAQADGARRHLAKRGVELGIAALGDERLRRRARACRSRSSTAPRPP